MARAVTLRQLKSGLRLRLNEIVGNVFDERAYPDSRDDEVVDELKTAINDAQLYVARDLYDPETYPWGTLSHEIPVLSNADYYVLPEDCVEVAEIWHQRQAYRQPMYKRHIKDVDRGWTGNYGTTYYQYYDTGNYRDSVYVAIGTASESHPSRLEDQYGDFSEVRHGDIAYNLTDNSEGVVTGFTSGYIDTELMGGSVNQWRAGDNYGIAQPEQTRKILRVYPRITVGDSEVYQGSPSNIEIQTSEIIDRVRVRFDSLPSDYQSDERVRFTFFDTHNLQTLNNLLDGESIAGEQMIRVGWNTIPFRRFQIHQNVVFHVLATRENNANIPIAEVELSKQPVSNRLILSYAKRPRLLVTDDSLCEFDNELLDCLYQRAKMICLEKLEGKAGVKARELNIYNDLIAKAELYLWKQDEPGGFQVEVDDDGDFIDRVNSDRYQWTEPRYLR